MSGRGMTPAEFAAAYLADARRSEALTGVPALFALAQAALETGWGRHAPGNMMFGIKATAGWRGKRQLCVTREVFADRNQGGRFPEVVSITPRAGGGFTYVVKDWFRAYDSPAESFADHGRMLRGNARYARAFETSDPREFARRIAAAGYATDPDYAASLLSCIGLLERAAPEAGPAPAPANLPPAPAPRPESGFVARLFGLFGAIFGRRKS